MPEIDKKAEYRAVREVAGLLDRSEAGKLVLSGADRFSWLQGMVSNNVRLLEQGATRIQACVLNATGHVLTDLALINVQGPNPLSTFLALPNSDFVLADLPRINLDKIATLFDRYIILEDVEVRDVSATLGCVSVQGPRARAFWRPGPTGENNLPEAIRHRIYAVEADYTGSGGFDLYFPTAQASAVRAALVEAGIIEVGKETQEVLRVEAGIPHYGVDMEESVIALEANLGPTHISLTKGCYVGQEIIARIDSRGHTNRALTGLVILGELPHSGDRLIPAPTATEPAPREVGWITSVVTESPAAAGRPIALGYVRHELRVPGTRLRIVGENFESLAEVAALPFYKS